jgi:DNA-directed RNA polymerase specialized sigma24 family protein
MGLGLKEIGKKFGVSYTRVSHLVGRARREISMNKRLARKILNHNPKPGVHFSGLVGIE